MKQVQECQDFFVVKLLLTILYLLKHYA